MFIVACLEMTSGESGVSLVTSSVPKSCDRKPRQHRGSHNSSRRRESVRACSMSANADAFLPAICVLHTGFGPAPGAPRRHPLASRSVEAAQARVRRASGLCVGGATWLECARHRSRGVRQAPSSHLRPASVAGGSMPGVREENGEAAVQSSEECVPSVSAAAVRSCAHDAWWPLFRNHAHRSDTVALPQARQRRCLRRSVSVDAAPPGKRRPTGLRGLPPR